jgi:S1-C subfamily serine protease/predicted negative regulator of RcsB-dependent stress response
MRKVYCLLLMLIFSINLFAQSRHQDETWPHFEGYTEEEALKHLDQAQSLISIEGIWQSSDGFRYMITKADKGGKTQLLFIVLASSHDNWSIGDIKAVVDFGSVDNVMSMTYYIRVKGDYYSTYRKQTFLIQESPTLLSFQLEGNNKKFLLYRLYPLLSDNEIDDTESVISNEWSGSGIAIDSKHIATNYHVVENAKTLVFSYKDDESNKDYEVEVVATDRNNDLAILKVVDNKFKGFPTIKYGFSTTIKDVGTDIFVLGYPLIYTMGDEIKLTNGIISAKSGFQGDVSLYQISAPIQPGNSGGPLFDDRGDLIGIINAKHTGTENVGYAIKLSYLKNLIESSDLPISLKSNNTISSYSLKDKVKTISPFVVMLKANQSEINRTPQKRTSRKIISISQIIEADKLYRQFEIARNKGDINLAYELIQKSDSIHSTGHSKYSLARAAYLAGDYDMAIELCEQLLATNHPLYEDIAINLANIHTNQNDTEKAIRCYTLCINKNNHNLGARYMRALLIEKNDRIEAIKEYEQIINLENHIERTPKNLYYIATSYNQIAWSYLCLGVTDSRVNDNIIKALKRANIYNFIWDTDGEYAYKVGQYERCINSMNNAITISKANDIENESENSYLYRGLAYLQLGNLEHAYIDLKRAMELGDSTAQEEIKKIDISRLNLSNITKTVKYIQPKVKKNKSSKYPLALDSIEITNECTILHFISTLLGNYTNPVYSIMEDTYIMDTSTKIKYQILATENCLFTSRGRTPYKSHQASFKLYFPKLPASTTTIDFIEPGDSDWKIYGIELK